MKTTKNSIRTYSLIVASSILALGWIAAPRAAKAANVTQTAMAGPYSITLKVLPAESFRGPKAAMTRDAGAEPNYLNGRAHPNHHMVVFVKKEGAAVENATVTISYKRASSKMAMWKKLPVVRMHVTGKSLATTHYGNNVRLAPGNYMVRVTVNGQGSAIIHFSLTD